AQNGVLQVQARIGELCTVTSASLDFGQDLDLEADTTASGEINIQCATPTELDVELDGGLRPGFGGVRQMANGQNTINYELYKDPGRTALWLPGDQVPATISTNGSV